MSPSRLTDEEIAGLLQEVEHGAAVDAVCDSAHVSLRTFYRWKKKFGGLAPAGVRQLKALRDENRELRRMLAERGSRNRPPDAAGAQGAPSKERPAPTNSAAREMSGLGLGRFATVRLTRNG